MKVLWIAAAVFGVAACTSPEIQLSNAPSVANVSESGFEETAPTPTATPRPVTTSTSSSVDEVTASASPETTTAETSTSTVVPMSSSAWVPTCEVTFHQPDMQFMDWMDEAMFSIMWVEDEFGIRASASSELMDEFGDVAGISFNVVVEFSSSGEFEGATTYDDVADTISFDMLVPVVFEEVFTYYLDGDPDFLAGEVRTHQVTAYLSPGGSCTGSLETRGWNDEVELREEFGWPEQPVGWNRW